MKKIFIILFFLISSLIPINISYASALTSSLNNSSSQSLNNSLNDNNQIKMIENFIFDYNSFLLDDNKKTLNKELQNIFYSEPSNSDYKVFIYIYNNQKSIKDNVKNSLDNFDYKDKSSPLLFILNTNNKEYAYVIDEKIDSYISPSYLEKMTDDILIKNNQMDFSHLEELLLRISTITKITIKNNIQNQNNLESKNVTINKDNFITYNFDSNSYTSNKENSSVNNNKAEENNSSYFEKIIGFMLLFSFIAVVVVFLKRTRNKK